MIFAVCLPQKSPSMVAKPQTRRKTPHALNKLHAPATPISSQFQKNPWKQRNVM
jgi:hypothetical protein